MPIALSRYGYDVEYSTMLSEFLQVHGTPASGKSTLAKLLSRHIWDQEPDVHVIWIGGWKLDDVAKYGFMGTISQLWVSFSPVQSLMSWFQSSIHTQSITSILPSSTRSLGLLRDTWEHV